MHILLLFESYVYVPVARLGQPKQKNKQKKKYFEVNVKDDSPSLLPNRIKEAEF